jgi:eukaryotic-like serine/threonine-protein kinase
MQSSTLRSAIDQTVTPSDAAASRKGMPDASVSQALQAGQTDLVVVLQEHPSLLQNRSLLMEMVFQEYRARRGTLRDLDLETHCRRFDRFGNSIRRSIQRELEVLRFIDIYDNPPDWPKVGDEIGRFRILEELGFGGSARVYLCIEEDVGNRLVIVKASPLPSFEASILGKLNHENIIPIYSSGFIEEWELNYLCMPYRGRSTHADLVDVAFQDGCPRNDSAIEIAANRWTSSENCFSRAVKRGLFHRIKLRSYVGGVLKLATQIAEALAYAHKQNIVHGDLKPSNVLLTPDGKPLLLDFNLSQDFTSDSCLRGGTLPYMPPEHLHTIAGKTTAPKIDIAGDVYSFGALLYELLAGVAPYHAVAPSVDPSATAALLLEAMKDGVPGIRQYNRFVSARLESLVLQCLAYDRARRPLTIREVSDVLQRERRLSASAIRQARLRPFIYSLVAGVSLALLTGTATYLALQPPYYIKAYNNGLRFASVGDLNSAAAFFASSARDNPSFAPARFQLARARLAIGDFDLAIQEFQQLAQKDGDRNSMECAGYSFNLKRVSVAAIPWYEMALQKGQQSAALYNNLGASYLEASTTLSAKGRLDRSELYLRKALELMPSSPIIRLNIVRNAVAKAMDDPSYDPSIVWSHAQYVATNLVDEPFIEMQIAKWYEAVQASKQSKLISRSESELPREFDAINARFRAPNQTKGHDVESPKRPSLTDRCYFLEPISLR